jgi:hypothetical protein
MKLSNLILSAFVVAILFFSCKKNNRCYNPADPNCENYDFCYGKKDIKADFSISEELLFDYNGYKTVWYPETDTVWGGHLIRFKVKTPYFDSVRWFIGAEELTDTEVYRRFFPDSQHTPITLVVYFKSAQRCNPGSNGTDTLTKIIYSYGDFDQLPIGGVYYGSDNAAPNQKYTIRVNDTLSTRPGTVAGGYGRNNWLEDFPYGNTMPYNLQRGTPIFGARSFYAKWPPDQKSDFGWYFSIEIKAQLTGTHLVIHYLLDSISYYNFINKTKIPGYKYVQRTWTGEKIADY